MGCGQTIRKITSYVLLDLFKERREREFMRKRRPLCSENLRLRNCATADVIDVGPQGIVGQHYLVFVIQKQYKTLSGNPECVIDVSVCTKVVEQPISQHIPLLWLKNPDY